VVGTKVLEQLGIRHVPVPADSSRVVLRGDRLLRDLIKRALCLKLGRVVFLRVLEFIRDSLEIQLARLTDVFRGRGVVRQDDKLGVSCDECV
jgi:hypothetical protein